MKKQSLFTILDYFIAFLALILFVAGITGLKTSLVMGLIIIFSSLLLVLNYISNLLVKIKYNKMIEEQRKAEEELETQGPVINSNFTEAKGKLLEIMIFNKLKKLYPKAYIYRNIKCPKMYGEDAEIDILMLSETGIYIIEAKNFAGTYTGDWSNNKINIKYSSGESYEVYNPVIQNSYHYKYLQSISGLKSKYFRNIVVLGQNTFYIKDEVKKTIPSYGYITSIFKLENIINYINKIKLVKIEKEDMEAFNQVIIDKMI